MVLWKASSVSHGWQDTQYFAQFASKDMLWLIYSAAQLDWFTHDNIDQGRNWDGLVCIHQSLASKENIGGNRCITKYCNAELAAGPVVHTGDQVRVGASLSLQKHWQCAQTADITVNKAVVGKMTITLLTLTFLVVCCTNISLQKYLHSTVGFQLTAV